MAAFSSTTGSSQSFSTIAANLTRYSGVGETFLYFDPTEAFFQIPIRADGVFNNFSCRIYTNTVTATTTVKTRKNTANGNQSVSIGSSATGKFVDSVNNDIIAAGDLFNTQTITGATGTSMVFASQSILFRSRDNSVKIYNNAGISTVTASTTYYTSLAGSQDGVTSEAQTQFKIKTDGKLQNLSTYNDVNTRSTATTVGIRINGANGNLVISIVANTTGTNEDRNNTDILTSGNLINCYVTYGSGTGSWDMYSIKSELMTTNNKQHSIVAAAGGSVLTQNVQYVVCIGGMMNNTQGASASAESQAGVEMTFSNLECYISANTVTAVSTFSFQKDAVNGNQTLSIGSTATGYFEDTVNQDTVVPTNDLDYRLVIGAAASTSLTLHSIGTLMSNLLGTPFRYNRLRPRVFAPGIAR